MIAVRRLPLQANLLFAVLLLLFTLLLPSQPFANNMGCCVLPGGGCTTATATVCTSNNGTLQGVGVEICNFQKCSPGVGCSKCIGGTNHDQLCETDASCPGGQCVATINPAGIPALSTLGLVVLVAALSLAAAVVLSRRRRMNINLGGAAAA